MPPFGPTSVRKSPPFWPWPQGPSGPSPFVSPDLTVRHEAAAGKPLATSGADVTNWGNIGSLGASHDSIPNGVTAPPIVGTEGGIRFVEFEGIKFLGQAVGGPGEFTAPVGPAFRMQPFWTCSAQRLRAPSPAALIRWGRAYGASVSPAERMLDIPIAGNFALVYQGPLGNMTATVSDSLILAKWVVADWGFDGTTFRYGLNAVPFAVSGPATFDGDVDQTNGFFGSIGDNAHIDYRSWFSYRVYPTNDQRAQTLAYNMAVYPVTP